MPEVRIYVRTKAWDNILRKNKGDTASARAEIAQMVNEKYGA
jgi:hypothetical protein